jgi:hypothetical protein
MKWRSFRNVDGNERWRGWKNIRDAEKAPSGVDVSECATQFGHAGCTSSYP